MVDKELTDDDYLAIGLNPPAKPQEQGVIAALYTKSQAIIRRNHDLSIFVFGLVMGVALTVVAHLL